MQHLEVSSAVRHIYIYMYIYIIKRLEINFYPQAKYVAIKTRALGCFELSGATSLTTRLHIPEDMNLQQQCCEDKNLTRIN